MTADVPLVDVQPGYDAVDLFAGPGGWDVAARRLGIRAIGFELDPAACATRTAAGHATYLEDGHPVDLSTLCPRRFFTRGQIASPPCKGFAQAGKGQARQDSDRLLAELEQVRTATDVEALIADAHGWMSHSGTALVLEPLRWALRCCPSWLAWEQVPSVLVLWEACAVILRRIGYEVVTGYVHAEQYGVPQTRKRAVLLARAPWFHAWLPEDRVGPYGGRCPFPHPAAQWCREAHPETERRPLRLPVPTHSKYHTRTPDKLDPGVALWVSMADALDLPDDVPAAVPGDASWVHARPAPTIVSSFAPEIVAAPGYRRAGDPPRQKTPGSVRVSLDEASILQGFPADYPWQGVESKQREQIGNAVPPPLAEALLREVVGL